LTSIPEATDNAIFFNFCFHLFIAGFALCQCQDFKCFWQ
jgi:hypothetical protein